MTDDLKLRQWDRCWPGNINLEVAVDEALARITDLEARLAAAEAECWELHAQIVDLKACIAEMEAGEDALAEALQCWIKEEEGKGRSGTITAYNALAAYEARRKG